MGDRRLRQAILPISLLAFLFLLVHACVPKRIEDLRPISVTRVSPSAMPLGRAGSVDNELRAELTKRGEALWKITLSGDADWINEVKRNQLNSYAIVVRCDRPDEKIFALGPYVGAVRVAYYAYRFEDYEPASAEVQYDVYLPEKGRFVSKAEVDAPMPSYDLRKQRLALCISIAGGAMTGAHTRSNDVRVPLLR